MRDSEGKSDGFLIVPDGFSNMEATSDLSQAVPRKEVRCQKSAQRELRKTGEREQEDV